MSSIIALCESVAFVGGLILIAGYIGRYAPLIIGIILLIVGAVVALH